MGMSIVIGLIVALIISDHFRGKEFREYAKTNNEFPAPPETYQRSNEIFVIIIVLIIIVGSFVPTINLLGYISVVWGIYLGIKAIIMKEGIDQENGKKKIKLFALCFFWVILGMLIYTIKKLPF